MLRLIMQYKPSVSLYRHYNIQVPLVDSYTAIIIEPIAAIKLLIKILHYSIIDCMGRSIIKRMLHSWVDRSWPASSGFILFYECYDLTPY